MVRSRRLRSPRKVARKPGCSCVCCNKGSNWECRRLSRCRTLADAAEALRVRDAEHNWRIMYRIDADAILILEVYPKKTRKIPHEVIERCQERLKEYDAAVKAVKKQAGK